MSGMSPRTDTKPVSAPLTFVGTGHSVAARLAGAGIRDQQVSRCGVLLAAICIALLSYLTISPARADSPEFEFHPPAKATDATTPAIMRDLAERLIPVYQESDPERYLANLSAIQMVAGEYAAADVSRESLRDRRRKSDAGRPVDRALVFDLYAHAKVIEAEERLPFADSFAKSFRETLARLDDEDAYAAMRWLRTAPPVLLEPLQKSFDRLRTKDGIDQPQAVEVIREYFFFDAYRTFASLVDPLAVEDDVRRYAMNDEILIPSTGGTKLSAIVVRPKNSAKPLPALLEFTLRGTENDAKESAAHGYVGVVAYAREKPNGSRRVVLYAHEGEDARAVINWIAKQTWSDGRVAMYGDGYSGFTAWAAAKRIPAALKAIATSASAAPGVNVPLQGGIFRNSAYRWSLHTTDPDAVGDTGYDDAAAWRALDQKWYKSGRRYRDLGRLYGKPNPIFIRWLNHPSYDRYWQKTTPYRGEFAHIDIPVLTITGYYADSAPGDLYYFSEHHHYDPRVDHTLLVGPYEDGAMRQGTSAKLHGYPIDSAALTDLHELRFRWFDHVLKGGAKPPLLKDVVNYEVMGTNEWRHVESLDAMAGDSRRFYLDAAATGTNHRLTQGKPNPAFVQQIVKLADRNDVAWTAPTAVLGRSLPAHNGIVFQSDALAKPTEFTGLFSGRLDFTVNKMDMDLSIVLYELQTNGDYVRLFSPTYDFRASYAQDRVHRHLLKAGERQALTFKSERLTSRQLQAGSRLILVLGISKRPDREINYGTGSDVSEESIADGRIPLKVRWYGDSYIDIPVRK